MPKYKTVAQAIKELKSIDPELISKYAVQPFNGGVVLLRRGTIISSHRGVGSGGYGLYEVYPIIRGDGFRSLFGTTNDAIGGLSLDKAVMIAEATNSAATHKSFSSIMALELIAKEYFGYENKKTES
ncbi:MAG: hypothetical protein Q7J54_04785 [Candidatus Woesearchaeota archaeon]|nr:hypothetical protein [Candidatus Woesearchaeota archaeon]